MKAVRRIALNLRQLRVAQNVSQEGLALASSVDRSYVSRLERGLENPTVSLLEKLASTLRVDIVELLEIPSKGNGKALTLPAGRKRNA